jgi:hypothetical protein
MALDIRGYKDDVHSTCVRSLWFQARECPLKQGLRSKAEYTEQINLHALSPLLLLPLTLWLSNKVTPDAKFNQLTRQLPPQTL